MPTLALACLDARRATRCLGSAAPLAAAFSLLLALASPAARGQTTVTLDGTSGTNSISTSYTLSGDTTFDLGFFFDYVVVGGGGGGGSVGWDSTGNANAGGGGAGGQVLSNVGGDRRQMTSNLSVVVGAGGTSQNLTVTAGGDSSISGTGFTTVTALGGGPGGGRTTATNGGGAVNLGGDGNRTANAGSGRTGGDGVSTSITGAAVSYGGGGSAGGNSSSPGTLPAPAGGGSGAAWADGNVNPQFNGGNATANTGGGGGGAGATRTTYYNGGSGGSGIVMIRYEGGTTGVSGGTAVTGTGSAAGFTIQQFTSNGTFSVDLATRLGTTLDGTLSGNGGVTYAGPGRLALAADNSYLGTTTISSGTLLVGSGGTAGTLGAGAVTNNAALVMNRSNTMTVANAISGSGSLTQQGGGTTVLTGSNTYSGATAITGGTLQVGDGGGNGTLGGSGSIANAGTLAFNRSDAVTLSRAITGAGSLVQQGPGTTILTAANTYAGTTTVSAGTLQVGGGSTVGTLGTGNVAVAAGGTLAFNRSDDIGVSNVFSGDGSLVKDGSGGLTLFGANSYAGGTVVNAGTIVAANNASFGAGEVTFAGGRMQLRNGVSLSNAIVLNSPAASTIFGSQLPIEYLAVGGGGGGGGTRWETGSGGGATVAGGGGAGGQVISSFGGTSLVVAAPLTVTVGAGGGGGTQSRGGAGGSSSIAGTGVTTVTALGGGAAGGGGYSGVDGGGDANLGGDGNRTANLNSDRTGGAGVSNSITGSAVFYGGGGSAGGNSSSTGSVAGTDGGGSGAAYGGGTGTNPAFSGGAGAANRGGGGGGAGATTFTYLNGGAGGSGVVILRYAGDPIATGGTITAGTGSAEGYTLHTFSAGTSTFALTLSEIRATLSGDISGTGGFTLDTPSTLVLTGANSYAGDTIISDGVLQVGDGGGTGSLGSGNVTNNAALVFNRDNALAVANVISGSGSLTTQGSGTLTLSGTNTYSGGTTISAGTLEVTGVLGGGTYAGGIANAGSLLFNSASDQTLSGGISGAGSLTKSGTNNLVLSGINNYTGPTSITAGRLSVNGSLANSAVTVAGGAELGGIGTLGGAVTAQAGGRVSPGNSIGVLTQGDTTFDGGAIFKYEVDSTNLIDLSAAADLLVVNGDLNIAAGTLLEFSDLAASSAQPFVEDTTVFAMINYTGTWNTGLFTYNGQELANGSRFMVGSQMWEIDYAYGYNTATPGSTVRPLNFQDSHVPATGPQTFVAITAVPEPSTLALLAAGLAGLMVCARRRRRR